MKTVKKKTVDMDWIKENSRNFEDLGDIVVIQRKTYRTVEIFFKQTDDTYAEEMWIGEYARARLILALIRVSKLDGDEYVKILGELARTTPEKVH